MTSGATFTNNILGTVIVRQLMNGKRTRMGTKNTVHKEKKRNEVLICLFWDRGLFLRLERSGMASGGLFGDRTLPLFGIETPFP